MEILLNKQPGLVTAVGIGVGCMIGSGWLFAAYYAAQDVGPASIISWFIGGFIALILALLLAEIVSMFKQKALFSRLLVISHDNADLGFIVAISSWLGLVIVIPTEAAATVQYLSTSIPAISKYLLINHEHTYLGTLSIVVLVLIYLTLNFWGIRTLAKVSNVMAVIKIVIPVITALIVMVIAFNPNNFVSQRFAPYGVSKIFSGIVVCGIFYAYFGFANVAMFSKHLKDPQKNIPRALTLSILICFIIYSLLQIAFISGLPANMVAKGWAQLKFTSPFAELLMLLNVHILSLWIIVLYFDATVSPSGTAILYLGSASSTVTTMAQDKQFPKFFNKIHPLYKLSRRSLVFTTLVCCIVLLFFKSWRELMILVSIFQLISCISIPVAFTKLRIHQGTLKRIYKVKFGLTCSYVIFLILAYLMIQADLFSLILALILHAVFFLFYSLNYYQGSIRKVIQAFRSCWSIFLYMLLTCIFGYFNEKHLLDTFLILLFFVVLMSINFYCLIRQTNYSHE